MDAVTRTMPPAHSVIFFLAVLASALALPHFAAAQTSPTARANSSVPVRPKMIDGVPATPSEFPFQVALISAQTEEGREGIWVDAEGKGQFCGATLLNEWWVLTAAHCVYQRQADDIHVYAGATTLPSNPQEKPPSAKRIKLAARGIIIFGNKFNPRTFDNDIALLKLEDTAPPELLRMAPADNQASARYRPDETATVIGWGLTRADDQNSASAKLIKADIKLQSNTSCQQAYNTFARNNPGRHRPNITANMFCAGVPSGKVDSCLGDSGGFIGIAMEGGRFLQLGIVSFGPDPDCAVKGVPGVYTRLQKYEQWIRQQMSAN